MGCPAVPSGDSTGEPAIASQPVAGCPAALIPTDFQAQSVDHKHSPCPASEAVTPSMTPDSNLIDFLPTLTGCFHGPGFNNIFRPRNKCGQLNTQMSLNDGGKKSNVLELNLTEEHWVFTNVKNIANRGLGDQTDIFLNGVSYVQRVFDVGDPNTGQRSPTKHVPIHVEPGLIMVVPNTTVNPVLGYTISRMASIPHGTTINLQGPAPKENDKTTIKTAPTISPRPTMPFDPQTGAPAAPFTSQTATEQNTPRIPQSLAPFITAGTITQEIIDNPAQVLTNANEGKDITRTFAFSLSSSPLSGQPGGGTTNISFLEGTSGPNADVANVTVTFWFSTVVYKVALEPFTPTQGHEVTELRPIGTSADAPEDGTFPVFQVGFEVTEAKTISVSVTQIQYAQVVLLEFSGLAWPHVSVATLLPVRVTIPPQ